MKEENASWLERISAEKQDIGENLTDASTSNERLVLKEICRRKLGQELKRW